MERPRSSPLASARRPQGPTPSALARVLPMARQHLDMDLTFLGTFNGAGEMVCVSDGDERAFGIGWGTAVDDSPWRAIVEGRGSGLVHDIRNLEWGTDLLPGSGVRSLAAVPVQLPDGRPFGVLSCLSGRPRSDLGARHLRFLRALAHAISDTLEDRSQASHVRLLQVERILGAIAGGGIQMLFQPIIDLSTGETVGFEALARFPQDPRRPPRSWFAGARQVGMGIDLEVAAVRATLAEAHRLPSGFLSVNVSPETLVSEDLREATADAPFERMFFELVEHERMNDLGGLAEAVDHYRALGVRFAIDDAGAGFASLRHVLRVRPEILKLDESLTDRIETDPMQKLLATSLVTFAVEAGLVPAAQGIERGPQLETIRRLGVRYGQGRHLRAPIPAGELSTPA